MNKSRIHFTFILILIIAGLAFYLAIPNANVFGKILNYRLGLDLQGGTHLVYQADLSTLAPGSESDAMAGVRDVVERRVNAFGVGEPVVQVSGDDRLIVELPGITDIDDAVALIGETPLLEFRVENLSLELPETQEGIENLDPYDLFVPTKLSGAHLERAEVSFSGQSTALNEPQISIQFNSEGTELFKELTAQNIGRRIAIFLDGELIVAPVVQTAIPNGQAVITGQYTVERAREEATRLNSGALPVSINLLSQQNIGPSLGQVSIKQSLVAGIIGLIAVGIFMIVFYRLPGLLSTLALVIYAAITLSFFKIFGVTLTLASIAGFILSIGIAIDANILIFERTKEELRKGKEFLAAVNDGFTRAWPSIRDSNLSSLITAVVLISGTSFIRGFAITLTIGILISMFTAITVTRTFLRLVSLNKHLNTPRIFGIKESETKQS